MATLDFCSPLVKRFMVFCFTKITLKPTCWTPLPFFFILGTVCHNILHSLVKNQYKKFRNRFEFPTWFPSFLLCDKPLGMSVWEANLILSSLNFRNLLCDILLLFTIISTAGVVDSGLIEFKESWLETLCCVLWQHNLLSQRSSPHWNMGNFGLCFTKLANNTGNNIKGNCLTVC